MFWLVLFISTVIVVALGGLSHWLSHLWVRDSQKASPYECGFDPFVSSRSPFSVRFYMVAILFLVFEVESLLFFSALHAYCSGVESVGLYSWGFLVLLVLGLAYELFRGALEWSKD
uniref:NADH-ubiquinone oxidoreductase chain 3 n=1 Tax=Argopecten purpuratus TaxID=228297 RepID=V9PJ00_ARGPU|nr:NADH dehydrogenase subunit 3 [Argopecten purpuratus]AGZ92275.1 NADH dehydrogenase subunit 3 [Argopecten purpuratus]ALA07942.1 NADH dehydrogenase subunit 3 [Argopecten purpuratus]ARN58062.1 NADH dehydrogenase subunit 3 [Argopecten purpuratus]